MLIIIAKGSKSTFLRFWELKVLLIALIYMDSFNGLSDIGWVEDYMMIKHKLKDKIVTRFKGWLFGIIKKINGRFNDYSISPAVRQVLLHWGYELEDDVLRTDLIFSLY